MTNLERALLFTEEFRHFLKEEGARVVPAISQILEATGCYLQMFPQPSGGVISYVLSLTEEL